MYDEFKDDRFWSILNKDKSILNLLCSFVFLNLTIRTHKNNTYNEIISKLKMQNLLQKDNQLELNTIDWKHHIFAKIDL